MKATGPVHTGEAPGRIDFMGGVADYSGSLVLQTPIRAAARVSAVETGGSLLYVKSTARENEARIDLAPLRKALGAGAGLEELRGLIDSSGIPSWARYSAGSFLLFCRHKEWLPAAGLALSIESDVPESMGVASSAALEIATLRALASLAGRTFEGTELARLGQLAENNIVGAPCGLMDQLASAYGRPGALLPILCRPDIVKERVALPDGVRTAGWPSGVRHDVGASPYAAARAATFMGKKIFEMETGQTWEYASAIPPDLFERCCRMVPETVVGREFIGLHGGTDDPLTQIDRDRIYAVRSALRFPIEENARCEAAESLLRDAARKKKTAEPGGADAKGADTEGEDVVDGEAGDAGPDGDELLRSLGELMLRSHAGYTSLGLGSPATDAMVEAAMQAGPGKGIYGARASGGGSGGTVVVLLERSAMPLLEQIAVRVVLAPGGPLPLIT